MGRSGSGGCRVAEFGVAGFGVAGFGVGGVEKKKKTFILRVGI